MKFTENFNLNLPDLDDMADVEKLNENFQTIDTTMKSLETDPELAANVVDIKNKIGKESDADTQPTLFGRLAQLKNVLLEKLAEMLTKVTGIDTKIGTSSDKDGTATLFSYINKVLDSLGVIASSIPPVDMLGYKTATVKVPIQTGGVQNLDFVFDEGAKKIYMVQIKGTGSNTASYTGTFTIEVDGTEYQYNMRYDGMINNTLRTLVLTADSPLTKTVNWGTGAIGGARTFTTSCKNSFSVKGLPAINQGTTQQDVSVVITYV